MKKNRKESHLSIFGAQTAFGFGEHIADQGIQALADALKHHQVQRDTSQSVEYAECFSLRRCRCAVSVADGCDDHCREVESTGEFPLKASFMGNRFDDDMLQHL